MMKTNSGVLIRRSVDTSYHEELEADESRRWKMGGTVELDRNGLVGILAADLDSRRDCDRSTLSA